MSDERAEFVIHAKLKNNLLLSRILERSKNVNAFCEAHGLAPAAVGELVNMKEAALNKDGNWCKLARTLATIFGVLPDELFSEEQRYVELKTNEAYIEISRRHALEMADPFQALENGNLVTRLLENAKLSGKERQVLKMRFTDEMLLDDCAKALDVTRERVRQIEAKALRKLRCASGQMDAEGNSHDPGRPYDDWKDLRKEEAERKNGVALRDV